MDSPRIQIRGGTDTHMVAAVTAAVQQLLTEEAAAAATQRPPPTLSRWAMQARWSSRWYGVSAPTAPLPTSR